jgi:hypothetical protein
MGIPFSDSSQCGYALVFAGFQHASQRCQELVKIGVIDFGEISPFKSFPTSLDQCTQCLEPQGVFLPALLEDPQRVSDHLVRVLVLASPNDAFYKFSLLLC